jgi:hypothetical protein
VKTNRSWNLFNIGWTSRAKRAIAAAVLSALAGGAFATLAIAQDDQKKKEIHFDLAIIPQAVPCLQANNHETPRARATVVRGKQNDTLLLDLDGVKPGLTFSVFALERSNLDLNGNAIKPFPGFGLALYQSDVETPKRSDDGHVAIKMILLDENFAFDNDVKLPPTSMFHLGLWFDDPQDSAGCFDPTKPSIFNGEHKAGGLAFITVPDATTGLGPLCTDGNPATSTAPASCKI